MNSNPDSPLILEGEFQNLVKTREVLARWGPESPLRLEGRTTLRRVLEGSRVSLYNHELTIIVAWLRYCGGTGKLPGSEADQEPGETLRKEICILFTWLISLKPGQVEPLDRRILLGDSREQMGRESRNIIAQFDGTLNLNKREPSRKEVPPVLLSDENKKEFESIVLEVHNFDFGKNGPDFHPTIERPWVYAIDQLKKARIVSMSADEMRDDVLRRIEETRQDERIKRNSRS